MDAQKRISELIDLINYHNDKYYNVLDFDTLLLELR